MPAALALASEYGVRLSSSGFVGMGFQPNAQDLREGNLLGYNSLVQCWVGDEMHVYTGGVWKRTLVWIFTGEGRTCDVAKGQLAIACNELVPFSA